MEEEHEYKICLTDSEALVFSETGTDYDSWIMFIGVLQKVRKAVRDQSEERILND